MKTLFCTDGSEASYYAIKKALPFLKQCGQIDIKNVMDWGFFPTYASFQQEEYDSKALIAQDIIDKSEEIINSFGLQASQKAYLSGNPAEEIINEIKKENYEMVIMGSHGKKGIHRWLGSVSRKIVNRSACATFIARPPKNKNIIIKKDIQKILIATDGSKCSFNAISFLINNLNIASSKIYALSVKLGAESLPLEITMDNEWLESCLAKQEEIAQEILDKAQEIFTANSVQLEEQIIIEGDAAEKIIDYAEENEFDLIIMGSHGREGVSDFVLGSVSKRVLDNSYTPVLIIPTKE